MKQRRRFPVPEQAALATGRPPSLGLLGDEEQGAVLGDEEQGAVLGDEEWGTVLGDEEWGTVLGDEGGSAHHPDRAAGLPRWDCWCRSRQAW